MGITEWMQLAAVPAFGVMAVGVRGFWRLLQAREEHRAQERLLLARALRDAVGQRWPEAMVDPPEVRGRAGRSRQARRSR